MAISGAALLAADLAVTATVGGLDATARTDNHGVIMPAFHAAAADHAVPCTPVCSLTPLPPLRCSALQECVRAEQDPAAIISLDGV